MNVRSKRFEAYEESFLPVPTLLLALLCPSHTQAYLKSNWRWYRIIHHLSRWLNNIVLVLFSFISTFCYNYYFLSHRNIFADLQHSRRKSKEHLIVTVLYPALDLLVLKLSPWTQQYVKRRRKSYQNTTQRKRISLGCNKGQNIQQLRNCSNCKKRDGKTYHAREASATYKWPEQKNKLCGHLVAGRGSNARSFADGKLLQQNLCIEDMAVDTSNLLSCG